MLVWVKVCSGRWTAESPKGTFTIDLEVSGNGRRSFRDYELRGPGIGQPHSNYEVFRTLRDATKRAGKAASSSSP